MIVNWYIESYEGGEGVLTANIEENKAVADILHSKKGFEAYIYEDRHSSKRDLKTDRSLIELMNWVEEELKFRMSHVDKATPTSCSNKGHNVSFRTGAVDECRTCDIQF